MHALRSRAVPHRTSTSHMTTHIDIAHDVSTVDQDPHTYRGWRVGIVRVVCHVCRQWPSLGRVVSKPTTSNFSSKSLCDGGRRLCDEFPACRDAAHRVRVAHVAEHHHLALQHTGAHCGTANHNTTTPTLIVTAAACVTTRTSAASSALCTINFFAAANQGYTEQRARQSPYIGGRCAHGAVP